MANPSLKAQIEAAKSALASDLAAPSFVTPPPKPPPTPITPNSAGNDTAGNDTAGNDTAGNNIAADNGTNDTGGITANDKSAHATNAAALDERITRLEAKLLDNQRDLHTLLQKIREISRLQTNSGKSRKNRAKDQAESMANDETEAEPRQSQRSPVVMVAMAILIGLVGGIAYFLVTAKGDLSALTVPSWVPTIIDRFNGLIG
jgi:hypothetical protein